MSGTDAAVPRFAHSSSLWWFATGTSPPLEASHALAAVTSIRISPTAAAAWLAEVEVFGDMISAGNQAFLRDPSGNLIELNQPQQS